MTYQAVQNPRIGWIGAGRMGLQLCTRLVEAGYDVAIYNRTPSKCAPVVARGAVLVESPADLADRDVVFSMVSASADLLEVVTGERGVLSVAGSAPALLVDHSTVSMQASAETRAAAAKRGTGFLAAPVSGNPKVVSAGLLTLAVSGPRATFDEALPLLSLLGRVDGRARPRGGHGQLARRDHLGVPADRGGQELRAAALDHRADTGRGLEGDGGGIDDDLGHVAVADARADAGQQPAFAADHRLEVGVGRDHDDDDVPVGQVGRAVDDLRAMRGEGLALRARPVVDAHVIAGLQQAQGELVPHASGTNPPDGRLGDHASS